MLNKLNLNFYIFLFSLIPVSIILGSAISLINISIIIFFFALFTLNKKFFFLIKDKAIICFFIIYVYLIFNSLISIDIERGIYRNFGFLRFLFLFVIINFIFFLDTIKSQSILKFWFIVILIVIFDAYIEIIFGKNLLGYGTGHGGMGRLFGFFKDESIVAAYLNGFIFIIFGYLFNRFEEKNLNKRFLIYLFIILCFICILFTLERSNTIKFIFGSLLFFALNHHIKFKFKIFSVISAILIIFFVSTNSKTFNYKYGFDFISKLKNQDTREIFFKENIYMIIYKSGIEVFKKYPYLGVGNKNYRVETCNDASENEKYICNSHPHQIYIELLAEHGLFGSILLLSTIFYLIFKNLKVIIISRNLIQIGSLAYLLTNFLPIIPGGSFFNDFNLTLFWINLSLLYASNPKTNIFNK